MSEELDLVVTHGAHPIHVRVRAGLRRPHNWVQLAKFCTVGICGCRPQKWRPSMKRTTRYLEGRQMKLSITLSALLIAGFMAASTEQASAVVYCQYVSYPAGCIVRPGVVLRPRPVARAVVTPGVGAVGVGVRRGTPMNRGGPVNRVGRR